MVRKFRTYMAKQGKVEKKWYLVDAEGVPLGRLAAKVASILRGKHKPTFTPHVDCGDNVIVINAAKVKVTGKKYKDKLYFWHSGYPGGLKVRNFESMIKRKPTFPVEHAIKGMLPKNRLGRKLFKNLRVYPGPEHPHKGLPVEKLEIK